MQHHSSQGGLFRKHSSRHHSTEHHSEHHRHHYTSYGVVDLGQLPPLEQPRQTQMPNVTEAPPRAEAPAYRPVELTQREFQQKYSPALARHYRKRKSSSQWLLAAVLVLAAVILVGLLFRTKPAEDPSSQLPQEVQVVTQNTP